MTFVSEDYRNCLMFSGRLSHAEQFALVLAVVINISLLA